MAKAHKKEARKMFRDKVFKRDGYRCAICGVESSVDQVEQQLDAHHVTPRELLPNGGYVKENGISLCDPAKHGGNAEDGCHWKAEYVLRMREGDSSFAQKEEDPWWKFAPEQLYEKIKSNLEQATKASESLR